ncbi:MAG: tetratricopeptide repeat protein [Gemmatimonadaceae bacterium]
MMTARRRLRQGILSVVLMMGASAALQAQTVQYRSPAGVVYRSLPDPTGTVAKAAAVLASDPGNIDKIIALGTAQAGVRQMREAIATFSAGIAQHPKAAILYRWRGHRYLSVREFAKAEADFRKGMALDSAVYGIWYHWGIVKFVRGDFAGAAAAFTRAQPLAPDPGELKGSTDWLWMSLARAGRKADATAMLARKLDSLPTDTSYGYTRRLRLYRGEITPAQLFGPADTADVQVATLRFGLGNYYLVRGDTAQARAEFQKSVASGGWAGFGFIVSEAELRRTSARGRSK